MNERITTGAAFLFLIVLYFWGNAHLAVTAPVEVNYAQTAKEMLAAGPDSCVLAGKSVCNE